MKVLTPNNILNTYLGGRVWRILENLDLKISNTQPRRKKSIAYKKTVYYVSIEEKSRQFYHDLVS